MKLGDLKKGEIFKISNLPEGNIRSHALRLGMTIGAKFLCYEIVNCGPVVIQNKAQQIAIGRNLANKIEVEPVVRRY